MELRTAACRRYGGVDLVGPGTLLAGRAIETRCAGVTRALLAGENRKKLHPRPFDRAQASGVRDKLKALRNELLDCEVTCWLDAAANFEIALNVLAQNVAFEIHGLADFLAADICVLVGERNDGDFRNAPVPTRHGHADSVDRDRALRDDVLRERIRHFHSIPPVLALAIAPPNAAGGVHV